MLRSLVLLGGHAKLVGRASMMDEEAARAVGLSRWIDERKFRRGDAVDQLRNQLRKAEEKVAHSAVPKHLRANVARIAALTGLNEHESRILEFAVLLKITPLLVTITDFLGNLTAPKAARAISVILNLPSRDVMKALAPQSVLSQSGLIRLDREYPNELNHKLSLLSENFAEYIVAPASDPMRLIRDVVVPAQKPSLSLRDYRHVAPALDLILPYMRHALTSRRPGVNIFIYGPPGTGKTELARTIAQAIGCRLYDVASENCDGHPVEGEKRLCALRTAQNFLVGGQSIAAFDEAEDVFSGDSGFFGKRSIAQSHKAWINRQLEGNRVPVIWLSNDVDNLDPAFVRRFDFVVELPIPPRQQRERMIARACAGLLGGPAVRRLAESESLSPAVISRAASVMNSIRGSVPSGEIPDAVEMLVGNTLEAQGHRRPRRDDPNRLPETYDPANVTADADLVALTDGLRLSKAGRLCLYGPPGTGKTAFARWIAQRLDLPLEVKRASDLMSKWLGESERNIARAFRQAEQGGAILLIDEVDSFLQDRRGAQRSWEVTQVNEMLTQMESHSGIFIASTNLVDSLDQAALRRFDMKVQFGFLQPQQARRLLQEACQLLGLSQPDPDLQTVVSRLEVLTPGDFATVRRQSRFRPFASPADLVQALELECSMKTQGRAKLGF